MILEKKIYENLYREYLCNYSIFLFEVGLFFYKGSEFIDIGERVICYRFYVSGGDLFFLLSDGVLGVLLVCGFYFCNFDYVFF